MNEELRYGNGQRTLAHTLRKLQNELRGVTADAAGVLFFSLLVGQKRTVVSGYRSARLRTTEGIHNFVPKSSSTAIVQDQYFKQITQFLDLQGIFVSHARFSVCVM